MYKTCGQDKIAGTSILEEKLLSCVREKISSCVKKNNFKLCEKRNLSCSFAVWITLVLVF